MGKLDEMRREAGANVGESMGQGRDRSVPPAMTSTMPARLQGIAKSKSAAEIPVDKIDRDPNQPREEFEPGGLERLAESLKTRGQLQAIRVRWDEPAGVYRIIMGERRWRAAKMAGLATLSCVISEGDIPPAELIALQVVENALREDLQPVEQAKAYKALMDLNGWSGNQLSKELAIAQSSVVRALALLDLAPEVQGRVTAGDLAPSVAYEVSRVADPGAQREIAERVVAGNLSRAEAVEMVRQVTARAPRKPSGAKGRGVKAGPPKPRTFRLPGGKVTVEPKRDGSDDAIADMLRAILEQLVIGEDQEAA